MILAGIKLNGSIGEEGFVFSICSQSQKVSTVFSLLFAI